MAPHEGDFNLLGATTGLICPVTWNYVLLLSAIFKQFSLDYSAVLISFPISLLSDHPLKLRPCLLSLFFRHSLLTSSLLALFSWSPNITYYVLCFRYKRCCNYIAFQSCNCHVLSYNSSTHLANQVLELGEHLRVLKMVKKKRINK